MDFEFYNPSDDKQSCVVRTMTKLTGKKYSEVKRELIELADKLGFDTYNTPDVFEVYMKNYGLNKIKDFTDVKLKDLNLEKGKFCLFCTNRQGFNHLIPLIDNVIYDRRNDSLDLYVIRVYQKI